MRYAPAVLPVVPMPEPRMRISSPAHPLPALLTAWSPPPNPLPTSRSPPLQPPSDAPSFVHRACLPNPEITQIHHFRALTPTHAHPSSNLPSLLPLPGGAHHRLSSWGRLEAFGRRAVHRLRLRGAHPWRRQALDRPIAEAARILKSDGHPHLTGTTPQQPQVPTVVQPSSANATPAQLSSVNVARWLI